MDTIVFMINQIERAVWQLCFDNLINYNNFDVRMIYVSASQKIVYFTF